MKFWNILKYVFGVIFFLIMVVAVTQTIEDNNAKESQQIVTPQSKFNF